MNKEYLKHKITLTESLKLSNYLNLESWFKNLESYFTKYDDLILVELAGLKMFFVRNPEHICEIHRSKKFLKKVDFGRFFEMIMGHGLVASEGNDYWKANRKTAQPFFVTSAVENYIDAMNLSADGLVSTIEKRAKENEFIEIHDDIRKSTLEITFRTLLLEDFDDHLNEIRDIITFLSDMPNFFDYISPSWLPSKWHKKFTSKIRILDEIVYKIIHKRKDEGIERADYLGSLLNSKNGLSGDPLNPKEIRDEIVTILVAGHETSSNGLGWTLMTLAEKQEIQEKCRSEIRSVIGDEKITRQNIKDLKYLKAVVEESMRLFPPIMLNVPRYTKEPEKIGNITVPANSYAVIIPYLMQRHPKYWKDPDSFIPERFLEGSDAPTKTAYFPFSTGRRKCAGADFALSEIIVILARLIGNFEILPDPSHKIIPVLQYGSLAPKNGLKLKMQKIEPKRS